MRRLSETLTNAGIPVQHLLGKAPNPTIVFQPVATDQQKIQAQDILDGFDWSRSTDDAWMNAKSIEAEKQRQQVDPTLKAIIKILVSEINTLRVEAGLPPRTAAQIRTAIRNEI